MITKGKRKLFNKELLSFMCAVTALIPFSLGLNIHSMNLNNTWIRRWFHPIRSTLLGPRQGGKNEIERIYQHQVNMKLTDNVYISDAASQGLHSQKGEPGYSSKYNHRGYFDPHRAIVKGDDTKNLYDIQDDKTNNKTKLKNRWKMLGTKRNQVPYVRLAEKGTLKTRKKRHFRRVTLPVNKIAQVKKTKMTSKQTQLRGLRSHSPKHSGKFGGKLGRERSNIPSRGLVSLLSSENNMEALKEQLFPYIEDQRPDIHTEKYTHERERSNSGEKKGNIKEWNSISSPPSANIDTPGESNFSEVIENFLSEDNKGGNKEVELKFDDKTGEVKMQPVEKSVHERIGKERHLNKTILPVDELEDERNLDKISLGQIISTLHSILDSLNMTKASIMMGDRKDFVQKNTSTSVQSKSDLQQALEKLEYNNKGKENINEGNKLKEPHENILTKKKESNHLYDKRPPSNGFVIKIPTDMQFTISSPSDGNSSGSTTLTSSSNELPTKQIEKLPNQLNPNPSISHDEDFVKELKTYNSLSKGFINDQISFYTLGKNEQNNKLMKHVPNHHLDLKTQTNKLIKEKLGTTKPKTYVEDAQKSSLSDQHKNATETVTINSISSGGRVLQIPSDENTSGLPQKVKASNPLESGVFSEGLLSNPHLVTPHTTETKPSTNQSREYIDAIAKRVVELLTHMKKQSSPISLSPQQESTGIIASTHTASNNENIQKTGVLSALTTDRPKVKPTSHTDEETKPTELPTAKMTTTRPLPTAKVTTTRPMEKLYNTKKEEENDAIFKDIGEKIKEFGKLFIHNHINTSNEKGTNQKVNEKERQNNPVKSEIKELSSLVQTLVDLERSSLQSETHLRNPTQKQGRAQDKGNERVPSSQSLKAKVDILSSLIHRFLKERKLKNEGSVGKNILEGSRKAGTALNSKDDSGDYSRANLELNKMIALFSNSAQSSEDVIPEFAHEKLFTENDLHPLHHGHNTVYEEEEGQARNYITKKGVSKIRVKPNKSLLKSPTVISKKDLKDSTTTVPAGAVLSKVLQYLGIALNV